MKKTISIILIVLAMLLMHTTVFADMDAPSVQPYTATVTNADGASYYDYESYDDGTYYKQYLAEKGTLPYDTEITINYEEEQDGKMFGRFNIQDGNGNIIFGLVNLQDITILNEDSLKNYSPDYNQPFTFKVIKDTGVEIHKGPANAYEVIGKTIPFGTTITGYYFTEYGTSPWYYISYQGVVGYICELDGALGQISNNIKSIKTIKETNIYKNIGDRSYIKENDKPSGTIPANTIINSFLETDPWDRMFYLTGNGYEGYISAYDVAITYQNVYHRVISAPEGGLVFYENADENSKILAENIPGGTVLVVQYEQYDIRGEGWINVTYDQKSGWIYVPEDVLYANLDINDDEYNNLVSDTGIEVDNTVFAPQQSSTNTAENTTITENIDTPKEIEVTNKSLKDMAIICVVAGVIIALTAVVTVIYFNKKNKKNENNTDNK